MQIYPTIVGLYPTSSYAARNERATQERSRGRIKAKWQAPCCRAADVASRLG